MAMLEEALKAAAKGWEVFPIRRGTKSGYFYYPEYPGEPSDEYPKGTPYSWKAQASKDPERVRKFWTDHPDANIGVATGQRSGGLFIVDEDEKNNWQGIANYEKWIDDNTLYLDEGVMVKTPSGGRHEYYTATEEIVPTREGWLPGVDIRGENNGYVLLPPSYYEDPEGEHTGFYEWISSPEECSILSDKDDPNIVYLASSIAKNTYGLVFDPDGNPVPFTAVNGEVWEGRKTEGTGRGGNFPRNEDGKIPHGVRHEYIVHRTGYFVAKLKDTGLTPEAIQQIVLQDFRDNCEEPDNVKKDPAPGILRDIKKFLSKVPEYEKDPEWKQYCIFAWRAENGGEEWDSEKAVWDEVTAAGLRAKDEKDTLEQLRAKVPGRKKQPEQPAGGADPGRQQAEEAGKAGEETPPEPKKDKLQAFFEKIQTEAYRPHETGLQFFDNMLGGGIIAQSVLTIMAAPGTGKTTLAQQIAEEMADRKTPIVYLNFEMSNEQMLAKAFSYRLAKEGWRLTSEEILKGYQWTDTPRERVTRIYNEYREGPAKFIDYREDIKPQLDTLPDALEKIAKAAEAKGEPAPALVADYLQFIKGEGDNEAKIVKSTIELFKAYAVKHNTFVICITAINRTSAKSGRITLESGRDSSGIEYTGDYALSLQYYDIDQDKVDAQNPEEVAKLQLEPWRRLIIRVLKHRLGSGVGKSAKVYYNAAYNYFVGEKQEVPNWPERELKARNPFIPKAPIQEKKTQAGKMKKEDLDAAAESWDFLDEDEITPFPPIK